MDVVLIVSLVLLQGLFLVCHLHPAGTRTIAASPAVQSIGMKVHPAIVQPMIERLAGSGWKIYANLSDGFCFQFPPAWSVQEKTGLVKLQQGTITLTIEYDEPTGTDSLPGIDTSIGHIETRNTVLFMNSTITRDVLMVDGKDKVILYNYYQGQKVVAGDQVFTIQVHDYNPDYEAINIPERIQSEVDVILGSFSEREVQP